MTLLAILLSVGAVVALVASSVVHVDATRRDLDGSRRLAWTIAVGAASFGGFLGSYAFGAQLQYAYFRLVKPEPVATSPYELLAVHLTAGVAISALAVLVSALSTRRGRSNAEGRRPGDEA